MDAQSAQQPTSTTYARPQQPAEAFAATLPVETLSRIFELALQHFEWPNEEKGQAQRVNYGLVCRSWCSAALPLPHYTVSSSAKAQRLAQVLQATDRSRQAVRSLDITSEGEKVSGRGAKIAKLLSLCPKLERLTLDVNRDLCAPGRRHEDGALGKVVRDALCKVQLQEVGLFGVSSLPVSVLNK
ncbi:hypothetical protein BCR35DRAFT_83338 [Leucosporidium creatinivorum]|uniref:F-box domain-containing protein n=1 Tax=Leucosporidium creatinivorum TaxID=106004 RepID=A0A1Y2FHX0_9BASI|nr:hypothetical protein BCR35DRAFT_83338 [Leucosporidium creatinivorum]